MCRCLAAMLNRTSIDNITRMAGPKLLARSGLAISFLGHVTVLILGLIFAGANPFNTLPSEAIAVDIISASEFARADSAPVQPPTTTAFAPVAPAAPAADTAGAQPTTSPVPERRQLAAPSLRPQLSDPVTPQLPPSVPDQPEPNMADMFGLPLALPDGRLGGGFDAPAINRANIAADAITRFREHLRTCLTRPGSIAPTENVKVVLRVVLKPDGMLAATPTLIEASASAKGPALKESAISGLRACQPYTMLPANKYEEWKALDLSFTPRDFSGG